MPFELCSIFPCRSLSGKFRRLSASSNEFSISNIPHRCRSRRKAFGAVHFKKEKIVKQLEIAINNSDVTMIGDVMAMVDIAELEEDNVSYVKNACESGNVDVVEALLHHGAGVDSFGDGTRGPLHIAVNSGNLPLARVLLAQGADVNLPTKYELKAPLHLAVKTDNLNMMKLLLEYKANVNKGDLYGGRALHIACLRGNVEALTLLLDNGAEIDGYDKQGWTGLHFAAMAGHKHAVKYMVSRHANMDSQSQHGRTALHWACAAGQLTVVRELLSAKANPNIRDSNRNLPIDYIKDKTVFGLMNIYSENSKNLIGDKRRQNHLESRPKRNSTNNTVYENSNCGDKEFKKSKAAKQKQWKSDQNLLSTKLTMHTLHKE